MKNVSGLLPRYDLANARKAYSLVESVFSQGNIQEAILEASDDLTMRGDLSRVRIYVPTNLEKCTADTFERFLLNPKNVGEVSQGPQTEGRGVYSTWRDALAGTRKTGEVHRAFLILDTAAKVLADYVNRGGESLMSSYARSEYLRFLKTEIGEDLEWRIPQEPEGTVE